MTTLRILLVSHNFPPYGMAGVERATEATALSLRQQGHEVAVLTRRPSVAPFAPWVHRERHRGLEIFRIWGGGSAAGSYPGFQSRLERQFERTLIEWQPDAVMITHLMFHSPLYVEIAHRWGVPVALELHDFYTACERAHLERADGDLCAGPEGGRACATHCFTGQPDAELRWILRTQMFRSAVAAAEVTICPSRFVADYAQREFELRRAPIVIGNGVDPVQPFVRSERRRAPGTLRLASIGVAVPHKGLHLVIEAARLARIRGLEYTILGPVTQPYGRQLREAADAVPGLTLRMYGGFDPSRLSHLLSDTDALVVPSLVWETYSRVTREAFARGVPVLASNLGALPEAVHDGRNGRLFDPQRPSQLAAIFEALASDRKLLETLRRGILRSDWLSAADRGERLNSILCDLNETPVDRDRALIQLENSRALRSAALPDKSAAAAA